MNVYANFNNFVSQNCWRVFLSPVWRRRSVTSDCQPLHLLTPLQVRPPFPALMGIVSHMDHCKTTQTDKMITWQERNFHMNLKYVLLFLLCSWCTLLLTDTGHLHFESFITLFPCCLVFAVWCHLRRPVEVWQTNVQVLTSLLSLPALALVSAGSHTSQWMMALSYPHQRGKRYGGGIFNHGCHSTESSILVAWDIKVCTLKWWLHSQVTIMGTILFSCWKCALQQGKLSMLQLGCNCVNVSDFTIPF